MQYSGQQKPSGQQKSPQCGVHPLVPWGWLQFSRSESRSKEAQSRDQEGCRSSQTCGWGDHNTSNDVHLGSPTTKLRQTPVTTWKRCTHRITGHLCPYTCPPGPATKVFTRVQLERGPAPIGCPCISWHLWAKYADPCFQLQCFQASSDHFQCPPTPVLSGAPRSTSPDFPSTAHTCACHSGSHHLSSFLNCTWTNYCGQDPIAENLLLLF